MFHFPMWTWWKYRTFFSTLASGAWIQLRFFPFEEEVKQFSRVNAWKRLVSMLGYNVKSQWWNRMTIELLLVASEGVIDLLISIRPEVACWAIEAGEDVGNILRVSSEWVPDQTRRTCWRRTCWRRTSRPCLLFRRRVDKFASMWKVRIN
jgi:hypothetical protein